MVEVTETDRYARWQNHLTAAEISSVVIRVDGMRNF